MAHAVFTFFAFVAVLSALMCVTQRQPVGAIMWLIVTMLALAGIYTLLGGLFAGVMQVLVYEIDEFRCVFCGYCQEVCPEEAIHVGVHYENAEYGRDRFVYDLERLMKQTHEVSSLWDPSDPRGE